MLFESEWSGDAIAAPVWVTDHPEDEMFTGLGDCATDIRPDQSHEDPDCRDLAKSPHRRSWISPAVFDPRGTTIENATQPGDLPYECGLGDG